MTRYDRLARESPDFAHWKLPAAALVGVALYGVATIAVVTVVMIGLLVAGTDPERWLGSMGQQISLDDPAKLAVELGLIALLLPSVVLPVAVVWRRHVGYLHSVAGHLRWRWLGRCLGWAFTVVVVALSLAVAVALAAGDETVEATLPDARGWAAIAVAVALVPFQAAAEEYVFRGGLLQLIGSWTRRAAVPVLVTSLLFAAGHLYDFWGLVSVFGFGVVAAVVTIRTGGLEAAIALHIANNTVLMAFDVVGLVDSTGEGAGLVDEVVPSVLMCLVFWGLVERSARRHRIQRRRRPMPTPSVTIVPPPPYQPSGPAVAPTPPPFQPGSDRGRAGAVPPPFVPPAPEVPPNAPPYPGDPGPWKR